MTNADIFEIETVEPYPSAPAYYWVARKQIKNDELPKLKSTVPDVGSYDMIIVGSPVWWYTVSAPMLAFLTECDFAGKTVAIFATHGGNTGNFFADFQKKIKNAKVIDGIDFKKVSAEEPKTLNEKISRWLDKIKSSAKDARLSTQKSSVTSPRTS
jgi:flavodoxin